MSQLQPLIRTALLGTQREPLPEPAAGTLLAELIEGLAGSEPESALLSVAGALRISEMAGQLPRPASGLSAAAPNIVEDAVPCSAASRQRLAAMLDGRFPGALPEFLLRLARAGKRVPDEMLPAVLDYGLKAVLHRSLILPVLGQMGRWLAAQNPAWDYASPQAETLDGLLKLWRSAAVDQRGGLLIQLREMRPEWGLALAQSTWKSEPPAARSKFIRMLKIGLSAADEPFLEAALDDRDLSTRRMAADLLAQIPGSRLVQRMTAIASDFLRWTPGQQYSITITLPDQIPPAILRDGVLPITANIAAIVRRTRITTIVGAIPLVHWENAWGVSPEEVISAALNSAWPRVVIKGLILAATRQRNVEWARALLLGDKFSADAVRLAALLPRDEVEAHIARTDHPGQYLETALMVRLLNQWGGTWRETVARRWINALARHLGEPGEAKPPGVVLRMVTRAFGQACPTSLAEEAAAVLLPVIQPDTVWWTLVQESVGMLQFRRAMVDEMGQ
jgi:hypothetical protein